MKYTTIPPPPDLAGFIRHFWVGTWEATAGHRNTTHYVVANSATEITFAFNGAHQGSELLFSAVQGHTHLPDQFTVPAFHHLIGVSFHPHALQVLLQATPVELTREFIPLTSLLGRAGDLLNEKMALAHSTRERLAILSAYFRTVAHGHSKDHPAIARAMQEIKRTRGNIRIRSLADQFCLSPKQFNRRFKAFSGFNPKLYARIVRFESVIAHHSLGGNFTETAYANGFYDQAHFIHEFKSFTGFKPTNFWELSGEPG